MSSLPLTRRFDLRPLAARDLPAVIEIDAALGGRPRRAYFERRLAAAARDPARHLQLGVEAGSRLAGYMLGRTLDGEFGRTEPEVRLEAFGVAAAAQRQGLGRALAAAFEDQALKRGLHGIRTTARWREHALLGFLDRAGYGLERAHVLDRAAKPDFDPEARDTYEVALLQESDLEGVARIDRRHTGRDRRGFLCSTVREALADSAVRVSLAARADGDIAGYVMARVDYGDYGRSEPVAVIDTVGVDPLRLHQGVGRALLSQLFMNLAGLGVERVETVVESGKLDLMGLFCSAGFAPSERLSFVKKL